MVPFIRDSGPIRGYTPRTETRSPYGAPRAPSGPSYTGSETDPDRWMPRSACRTANPSLFFAPDYERIKDRNDREDAAKRVCARCPVVELCLRFALDTGQTEGVWGAMTPDERTRLKRRETSERMRAAAGGPS